MGCEIVEGSYSEIRSMPQLGLSQWKTGTYAHKSGSWTSHLEELSKVTRERTHVPCAGSVNMSGMWCRSCQKDWMWLENKSLSQGKQLQNKMHSPTKDPAYPDHAAVPQPPPCWDMFHASAGNGIYSSNTQPQNNAFMNDQTLLTHNSGPHFPHQVLI